MNPFILDHLWQSTLFAGVAGLLALALRRNSARLRHWLWFAASAKFLFPFAVLATLGAWLSGLWATPIAAPAISALQPMAEPFSQSVQIAAAQPDRIHFVPILFGTVWLMGFLVLAGRWLMRWTRLRRILRASVPSSIAAPAPVRTAASLLEPGLVGIWRPVILLPQGITERLSATELKAVLAHELCHLRRRDNLLAAIHMLVEALFWFHPLVWWLGTRLNEEREQACDEAVLAAGQAPDVYAESILKVCRFYLQSPLDCAAGISGADLKKRLEGIMENHFSVRLNAAKKLLLAGSAALAIAAPIAAGLLQAPPVLAQAATAAAVSDPAREAALRRFIEGRSQNNVPYDLLTADLADSVRKTPLPDWGMLKSLTFKGVQGSLLVYDAQFEKAHMIALIGPLTDGKISTLGLAKAIERAPGTESSPSPGAAQALRQLLDGEYRGQVPVELFGDAIAARFRNHQTPFGDENTGTHQALGAVRSITFLKVDAMGNDNYVAVYDHGHATWIIPPLVNGKVDNLLWGNVLVDNAKPHPGTEQAARRFVEIMQKGGEDQSLMLAGNPVEQQRIAESTKKLGALQSLAFKGSGAGTIDVYAATFANGPAIVRVDTIVAGKFRVTVNPGADM